jgi:hypothetical protein
MTIKHQDLLPVESERWTAVESHICQNRADMGHPSSVRNRDLPTGKPRQPSVREKFGLVHGLVQQGWLKGFQDGVAAYFQSSLRDWFDGSLTYPLLRIYPLLGKWLP